MRAEDLSRQQQELKPLLDLTCDVFMAVHHALLRCALVLLTVDGMRGQMERLAPSSNTGDSQLLQSLSSEIHSGSSNNGAGPVSGSSKRRKQSGVREVLLERLRADLHAMGSPSRWYIALPCPALRNKWLLCVVWACIDGALGLLRVLTKWRGLNV